MSNAIGLVNYIKPVDFTVNKILCEITEDH